MTKKHLIAFVSTFLSAISFFSCSQKAVFFNDMEQAKTLAAKKNKQILMVLSKEGEAPSLFGNKDFVKNMGRQYVLLFMDLSQMAEDSANILCIDYYVKDNYETYLLSQEGYVLQHLPLDWNVATEDELLTIIAIYEPRIEERNTLISTIRKEKSIEKLKAIDSLYEKTEENYRNPLSPLYAEAISIDKNNASSLLGKYELLNTYTKARSFIQQNDFEGASGAFVSTAQGGHLDSAQKADAFYAAAMVLATGGSRDFDRMLVLLEHAYDCDISGVHGEDIALRIQLMKKMKQVYTASTESSLSENINE